MRYLFILKVFDLIDKFNDFSIGKAKDNVYQCDNEPYFLFRLNRVE